MVRDLDSLWKEYRRSRSVELRNLLATHYLQLVRRHAKKIKAKLPDVVDVDDLMSAGFFGLNDAINSFDPGRGFKFETFAHRRIAGAMLDEIRAMDWAPRLVRQRTRQAARVRDDFVKTEGRKPTEHELAGKLAIGRNERDYAAVATVSLSHKWFTTDSGRDVVTIDMISDDQQTPPELPLHRRETLDRLCRGMTRRNRAVVVLYYVEGMPMSEIGSALGMSLSRVSQLHKQIVAVWKDTIKASDL